MRRSWWSYYNMSDIMASTMKIITSHLATSIETPATPRAPSAAATTARTKNTIANQSKSATFSHLPTIMIAYQYISLKLFIVFQIVLAPHR